MAGYPSAATSGMPAGTDKGTTVYDLTGPGYSKINL